MQQFEHASIEYRLLRFHWHLFLKNSHKLGARRLHYQVHLRYLETQVNLVHAGRGLDMGFQQDYEASQALQTALAQRDPQLLKQTLASYQPLHNEMDQVVRALRQHAAAVCNSYRYDLAMDH